MHYLFLCLLSRLPFFFLGRELERTRASLVPAPVQATLVAHLYPPPHFSFREKRLVLRVLRLCGVFFLFCLSFSFFFLLFVSALCSFKLNGWGGVFTSATLGKNTFHSSLSGESPVPRSWDSPSFRFCSPEMLFLLKATVVGFVPLGLPWFFKPSIHSRLLLLRSCSLLMFQ